MTNFVPPIEQVAARVRAWAVPGVRSCGSVLHRLSGGQPVQLGTYIGHASGNTQASRLCWALARFHHLQHAHGSAGCGAGRLYLDDLAALLGGTIDWCRRANPLGSVNWPGCCLQRLPGLGHQPLPKYLERGHDGRGVERVVHGAGFHRQGGRIKVAERAKWQRLTSAWCCGSGRRPGLLSQRVHRAQPEWFDSRGFPGAAQ